MPETIDELFERWDKNFCSGNELSICELTHDHPELREELKKRIAELHKTNTAGEIISNLINPVLPEVSYENFILPRVINNRFEVISYLGSGHFAMVWLAKDLKMKCEVALKFPLIHPSNIEGIRESFEKEAQLQSEVSNISDNIVQAREHFNVELIFDHSNHKITCAYPFIVMEKMDTTLSDYAINNKITPGIAIKIIADIADGLHAVHVCKVDPIIHGDIKPNNIFIKKDINGKITFKLGDFGLALTGYFIAQRDYIKYSKLYGNIDYFSPERLRGKPADVRSDQYSLGIVLFWLLTGKTPYSNAIDDEEKEQKILAGDIIPPATLNPTLNSYADIQKICLKAISTNPNDRYANAKLFSTDLLSTTFNNDSKVTSTNSKKTVLVSKEEPDIVFIKRRRILIICALPLTLGLIIFGFYAESKTRVKFNQIMPVSFDAEAFCTSNSSPYKDEFLSYYDKLKSNKISICKEGISGTQEILEMSPDTKEDLKIIVPTLINICKMRNEELTEEAVESLKYIQSTFLLSEDQTDQINFTFKFINEH